MKNLKFSEIIKQNKQLESKNNEGPVIKLKLLSNITVNQLIPILEFYLRSNKLNARIGIGDYDNIIQESSSLDKGVIPIVFWELSNLIESFVYEVENMTESVTNLFFNRVKAELDLLFQNTKNSSVVIFNKFSHIIYTNSILNKTNYERFVTQLNQYLEDNLPQNYILVDIDKVISKLSINVSIDLRNFYSSKALYTIDFFKEYTIFISPIVFSLFSKTKKALIFDCDNTLWKGVVGEDGINNIEISDKSKNGIYFREVHLLAKSLSNKGIILALCSKNNIEDVEEVFQKRTDMFLKSEDFIIRKINWLDKATNIYNIAKELNIGVDSLVFVDDSSFEVNLIKEHLPEVDTIQVPEKLYEYPNTLFNKFNLFYSISNSSLDKNRVKMYKENIEREQLKSSFQNIDDYISSLGIKMLLFNKEDKYMERVAQMTQKTNQFNLTTKRYTLNNIQSFYLSDDYDVLCINVSDKYGDAGITGLSIIHYRNYVAEIDTFLLSCRILGRKIEKGFLNEIIQFLKLKGVKTVEAKYIKTIKNTQVKDFYARHQFTLISSNNNEKIYHLNTEKYVSENLSKYLNISWKKK